MKNKKTFIIVDWADIHCFTNHIFKSYEDGWEFLYNKYPVIKLPDGKTNDQEDELNEYFVIEKI